MQLYRMRDGERPRMTQDEKLLNAVKATLQKETLQLTRKLKRMTEQRDIWRERARRYRQNLIEKNEARI